MKLWEMSFVGAVMVCGILLVRAAGYHRVSKQTFLVLWMAAALRFLTPWQLPWSPEFWGYLPENQKLWGERVEEMAAVPFAGTAAAGEEQEVSVSSMTGENQQPETVPAGREPGEKAGESYETQLYPAAGTLRSPGWYPVLRGIWLLGAAAVGVYFAIQYLIHRRKMRELLPAEDWPAVESWRERHEAVQRIRVFYTDYYDTPFSMGIFRKKIVLTREIRHFSAERLQDILEHEAVHLRRLDSLWKLAGILVVILHWFNPLAWLMLKKLEEDLEVSCDERVIRAYGTDARKRYAKTLLAMDRGRRAPFLANGFGGKQMRRRIRCVLEKKSSRLWSWAALTVCGIFLVGCMGGGSVPEEKTAESGTDSKLIASGTEKDGLLQQLALGTEIIYPENMTVYRGDPCGELVVAEEDSEEKWLMGLTMLPVDSKGNGADGRVNPGVYGAISGEEKEIQFNTYKIWADKGEGAVVSFEMKEPLPFTVGYVKDGIYTEVYQVQEQDITETSSGRYSICMSFPETGSYSVVIHNTSEEAIRFDRLHYQEIYKDAHVS